MRWKIRLIGANFDLRRCLSQASTTCVPPLNMRSSGLSFSTVGPYIRFVGLTDYGDKQAMK